MSADRPANHGQSSHGLRGDYSRMRPDHTVEQDHSAYTEAEHDRWRRLYHRQIELVPGRACEEYVSALRSLDYEGGIPRFETVNRQLGAATGWQLVAVPGLVPDLAFFDHLANRRFPVTRWIREEHEFGYIVEPDVFHDFFGHVPMLFDPVFADYMEAYGRGGLKAEGLGALPWLARLYWYTVEFGLIRTPRGLRSYGAGILSSPGEIDHALASPTPRRVAFDLLRIMRSRYRIDAYQETYFVIDELPAAVRRDRARLHAALPRARGPRGAGRRTPRSPATAWCRSAREPGSPPPAFVLPFGPPGPSPAAEDAHARDPRPGFPLRRAGGRRSAPAATPAKLAPMTVQVQAAAGADAGVQAWVKELRAALEARKDEFRLAKKGETPELVVRIDSVGKGQNDLQVMNGTLLMGKSTHPFNLSYPGECGPPGREAGRNLRKYADQLKTAPVAR